MQDIGADDGMGQLPDGLNKMERDRSEGCSAEGRPKLRCFAAKAGACHGLAL